MKNQIIYTCILLLAVACKTNETAVTTKPAATVDFPYTLEKPYKNWQIGDQQNVVTLMKMIKAWESKNVTECATYFADSVTFNMDKFQIRMSNDSIAAFLQSGYTDYNNIKITMEDFESVISEDKKDEWANIWYKQNWTNSKGIADSIEYINEAKMKDGKIIQFNEYAMHYPPAMK